MDEGRRVSMLHATEPHGLGLGTGGRGLGEDNQGAAFGGGGCMCGFAAPMNIVQPITPRGCAARAVEQANS